jgi:hypothetical protein
MLVYEEWCVYFIESDTGVKVGYSGNVSARLASIAWERSEYVEICGVVGLPSQLAARKLEAKFHSIFADKKIKGEWFDLTREDVAFALRLARTLNLKTYGCERAGDLAIPTSLSSEKPYKMRGGVMYERGVYLREAAEFPA